MGIGVSPVPESDPVQGLLGGVQPVPGRDPADLQPVGRVLPDGSVREEREVLEDHADLPVAQVAQLVVVHGENVLAVDDQLATRRLDEPVDHSEDASTSPIPTGP